MEMRGIAQEASLRVGPPAIRAGAGHTLASPGGSCQASPLAAPDR